MTAGTVVITGGILAALILLCIIAVLCYCRLQYYCCKHHESEEDVCSFGGDPQPQFACNVCSAPGVDGPALTPLSLPPAPAPPHRYCPTCSPIEDACNGAERVAYVPAHYENQYAMSSNQPPPLSACGLPDFYANTRPFSTDV